MLAANDEEALLIAKLCIVDLSGRAQAESGLYGMISEHPVRGPMR